MRPVLSNIYAVVTYHNNKRALEAAEAWKREGVCGFGWRGIGNLRKKSERAKALRSDPRFEKQLDHFLNVQKGDVVLAYARQNTIAYVGTARRPYAGPKEDNVVGRDRDEGGFGYNHQISMKWWTEPRHFARNQLPSWLGDQLGKRGQSVMKLDLGKHGFGRTVTIIKNSVMSGSALDGVEDLVKAGFLKYVPHRMDKLEEGLKIIMAERFTARTDKPDFVAVDRNGRHVIIECKGVGRAADCEQLEGYGRRFAKKKPRLILVAFRFDLDCRIRARSKNIQLVECDLKFMRV